MLQVPERARPRPVPACFNIIPLLRNVAPQPKNPRGMRLRLQHQITKMRTTIPIPINFRLLAERAEARELRQRRIDKGVLTPIFGSIKLSPRRGFLARVWAAR